MSAEIEVKSGFKRKYDEVMDHLSRIALVFGVIAISLGIYKLMKSPPKSEIVPASHVSNVPKNSQRKQEEPVYPTLTQGYKDRCYLDLIKRAKMDETFNYVMIDSLRDSIDDRLKRGSKNSERSYEMFTSGSTFYGYAYYRWNCRQTNEGQFSQTLKREMM